MPLLLQVVFNYFPSVINLPCQTPLHETECGYRPVTI